MTRAAGKTRTRLRTLGTPIERGALDASDRRLREHWLTKARECPGGAALYEQFAQDAQDRLNARESAQ